MSRKFNIALFLALAILLLPAFLRFVLQVQKNPGYVQFMENPGREFFILWNETGFFLNGSKKLEPNLCFSAGKKCFCIKTVPAPYRTVFRRSISELKGKSWKIGASGNDLVVKLSPELLQKTGCRGPVVILRREGNKLSFVSCLKALMGSGCTFKTIKPGKKVNLETGKYILLPSLRMRILTWEKMTMVPGKRGRRVKLFPVEARGLEIQEVKDVKPLYATLRGNEGTNYPLRKGKNIFKLVYDPLPLFPPGTYRSQREIFLQRLVRERNYRIERGFYIPVARSKTYKIANTLGYWKNFKEQLSRLNHIIGKEGIYSRMPCFRMELDLKAKDKDYNGNSLIWFYASSPGPGWKTSLSLSGWKPAFKREGWVCGELWSPHFRGTRKRYFKAILPLSFKPEVKNFLLSSSAFLFVNGIPVGNGAELLKSLKIGNNVLSLMLEISGIKENNVPLKIEKNLDLSFSSRGTRKPATPEKMGGKIVDRDSFSLPAIKLTEDYSPLKSGDEIAIGGKILMVLPQGREIKVSIGNRTFTIKSIDREKENSLFEYSASVKHFALGDTVFLWENRIGILRLKTNARINPYPGKVYTLEVKGDNLLISRGGKSFSVKTGENFEIAGIRWKFIKNRRGVLSYPCLSLKGWGRCYSFQNGALSTILGIKGISHGLEWKFRDLLSRKDTTIYLSIDDDLQKIVSDILEGEIIRIKLREREAAGTLESRIKAVERKLSTLKKRYRKNPSGTLVSRILSLEKQKENMIARYRKLKNPFYEGAILLMNQDGEILAAASYPYLPLRKKAVLKGILSGKSNYLINRCWEDIYTPGSTFKLVDSIAFLESSNPWIKRLLRRFPFSGKDSTNLKGKRLLSGQPIDFNLRNFREEEIGEKNCSLENALANSYNVYFAYISMHSYPPLLKGISLSLFPINYFKKEFPLLKYAEELGFNSSINLIQTPGIGLLTTPSIFPVNAYKLNEIAHYSIGQADLKASPLQMALVALSIYRRGKLAYPSLLRKIRTEENVYSFSKKQKTVFSEKTAWRIEKAMNRVITEGTAKTAFKGWFYRNRIFAKTGTAETALYKDNALFTGYFKVEKGKAVIFTIIIPRSGVGGRIAAPIARKLLESYLYYRTKLITLKR